MFMHVSRSKESLHVMTYSMAESWCHLTKDTLPDLRPLLSSIISLKLYRTADSDFRILPKANETFTTILLLMPKIQKVWIDVQIFEKVEMSWFASASVALMSKVQEFRWECNAYVIVPDEVMLCSMSLPLISMHLQVLRIDSFVSAWDYLRSRSDVIYRLNKLFRILRKNQKHLRSLQLKDPQLWTSISAQRFGPMPKFPQLKVLKLKMETKNMSEAHFIQFLKHQAESLEEIDLEFAGSIPSAVLHVIKNRATNLNLKVLRVTTSKFKPSAMKKWNFLKETHLEEFSFRLEATSVRLRSKGLKDFFGALPKNAKKLNITGVKPRGRQPIFNLEVSKCFDPKVLTHLNLRGCTGLLKDSVLQEFRKSLKNLRLLDLSSCGNKCTDWGFIGVSVGAAQAQEGVSISLLKHLKSLALQSCIRLTNRTLNDGITFLQLQFLDLVGNSQFTDEGYLAVMHQNPRLQTLVIEQEADGEWLPLSEGRRTTSVKVTSRLTVKYSQAVRSDCSISDKDSYSSDDGESESGEEDLYERIPNQRDPPLGGGGGDGSEVEEDEDELPDLY